MRDSIQKVFRSASFALPDPEEGKKIIEELHKGIYSTHTRGRTLAVTAIRTGYYWRTLREDAMTLARTCDKY